MFLWLAQSILSAVVGIAITAAYNKYRGRFSSSESANEQPNIKLNKCSETKESISKAIYTFLSFGIIFFALGFLVEIFDINKTVIDYFQNIYNNPCPRALLPSIFFMFSFMGFTNVVVFFNRSLDCWNQMPIERNP